MIIYYHRYVIKTPKNKNNYYQMYWYEEFLATENIEKYNCHLRRKFWPIDDIPLDLLECKLHLDRIKSIRRAPHFRGEATPLAYMPPD